MSDPTPFRTWVTGWFNRGPGPLAADAVAQAFQAILAGAWTPIQVGAFAMMLRTRGETAEVFAAAAQATREAMAPVDHGLPVVLDTCGTGGDGAHTLNLSSAAAIVVAACGLPVAKHGNRSASSRCGSADVFEAMGVPLDVPPERQGAVLRSAGFAFLFASAHHPALRHAGQARRELGTRTIFNALGPMVNPARPTHQLVGVYDDATRPLVARALAMLGTRRAWVVHSVDGLDEISPCDATRVSAIEEGHIRELVVTPEDFGVPRLAREVLAGGDAAENAQALFAIFDGVAHPARDAVVLNAGAAVALARETPLRDGAAMARSALDQGAARRTFETWKDAAIRARAS